MGFGMTIVYLTFCCNLEMLPLHLTNIMSKRALPCTPKTIEDGFIFWHGCLMPLKFFHKEKVDFDGNIKLWVKAHKSGFCEFLLVQNFH